MTEGESGKHEKCIDAIQGILRQLRGRVRWLTQNNGSCGARTAVVMSLVALGSTVGLIIASLPLFESKPGLVLATPASEKLAVVQVPTPIQEMDYIRQGMFKSTPVVSERTPVFEATLSRRETLNGLLLSDWLKLAECPEGSFGWQIRYLNVNGTQGEGFFNSSGGLTKFKGPKSWGLIVYDRLYINPNKDPGIHKGSGNLECLAGHTGSSRVTESYPLQYKIELTP